MIEAPRSKRFQIHLSTAIVMMFVAGGLMWANTRINNVRPDYWAAPSLPSNRIYSYGWPQNAEAVHVHIAGGETIIKERRWAEMGCVLNGAAALFILFAVWFLCEWLIRRRAARKGA